MSWQRIQTLFLKNTSSCSAPKTARRTLAVLLAVFQSCGPDAAESGLGLSTQLWAILAQVLRANTEHLQTSRDAEGDDVEANQRLVMTLVLSILSERFWAAARNQGRRLGAGGEGKLEGAGNGALEVVADWVGKVGERPSETVERLCQTVLQEDGLRDAVVRVSFYSREEPLSVASTEQRESGHCSLA